MNELEKRKKEEAEFHDKVRDERNQKEYERLTANRKFYSITAKSEEFRNQFIVENSKGKKVLDYCCGTGNVALFVAEKGASEVVGIDISPASIKKSRELAKEKGLSKAKFLVMDAEKTKFPDNYFDLIICSGVLHHLDIKKAYCELSRILKPEGKIICSEPLVHNPVFQLYRKKTPHLRTKWEVEHILSRKEIKLAEKYFAKIEKRFFHLAVLLAVPFRETFVFKPLLAILEKIDLIILKIPGLRWWAWQIVFILSEPRKNFKEEREKRKREEIEYYDREAEKSGGKTKEVGSLVNFDFLDLASYRFLYNFIKERSFDKKVLDYGCGTGNHLIWLAENSKEAVGIDLSRKSLEIAEQKIEKKGLSNKAKVLLMDCEKMKFNDNSFDIIFDGGVFSSLDLNKVLPELNRVLRPGGFVIGIETLGHNPIINLKRKWNEIIGRRTSWAVEHIFKIEDLEKAKKYFQKVKAYYFHLFSWLAFPFLNLPGGGIILKWLEKIDIFFLFIFPFLKKYSFKIVFVFSGPKKKILFNSGQLNLI